MSHFPASTSVLSWICLPDAFPTEPFGSRLLSGDSAGVILEMGQGHSGEHNASVFGFEGKRQEGVGEAGACTRFPVLHWDPTPLSSPLLSACILKSQTLPSESLVLPYDNCFVLAPSSLLQTPYLRFSPGPWPSPR